MKFDWPFNVNMSVGGIRVKCGWPFGVNMSVSRIRVNEGEIWVPIQCKYVCWWNKGE